MHIWTHIRDLDSDLDLFDSGESATPVTPANARLACARKRTSDGDASAARAGQDLQEAEHAEPGDGELQRRPRP
eukprot:550796-Prorocentrum_minimum.AAC.1